MTMRDEKDVLRSFTQLRRETLHMWIDRGWLTPRRSRNQYRYQEIDVARIRLIHEFSTELELDDEAMDVILPLLDQVHGLRHELRRFAEAVNAQPEDIRKRIAAALDQSD
jgi:chaperone modulatory protein CbpM